MFSYFFKKKKFVSHGSERERVCVWRRRYVTDPRPVPWVRKGRRHPGPFKVMTAQGWELRRIEWRRGGALVWESPFITFSLSFFFLVPLLLRLCAFLRLLLLRSALSTAFHHDGLPAHGTEGEKCPGFTMRYSNERRRGDSAVSAQRPHLLPFLLLPVSVWISVYLSRMHSAVSARAPACRCHPLCINIKWGEIIFHSWLLGLARGVLSSVGECHAVTLQFILKLNWRFVSRLSGQTVPTFRLFFVFFHVVNDWHVRVTLKWCCIAEISSLKKNRSLKTLKINCQSVSSTEQATENRKCLLQADP